MKWKVKREIYQYKATLRVSSINAHHFYQKGGNILHPEKRGSNGEAFLIQLSGNYVGDRPDSQAIIIRDSNYEKIAQQLSETDIRKAGLNFPKPN